MGPSPHDDAARYARYSLVPPTNRHCPRTGDRPRAEQAGACQGWLSFGRAGPGMTNGAAIMSVAGGPVGQADHAATSFTPTPVFGSDVTPSLGYATPAAFAVGLDGNRRGQPRPLLHPRCCAIPPVGRWLPLKEKAGITPQPRVPSMPPRKPWPGDVPNAGYAPIPKIQGIVTMTVPASVRSAA